MSRRPRLLRSCMLSVTVTFAWSWASNAIPVVAQQKYQVYRVDEKTSDPKSVKRAHGLIGKVFSGNIEMSKGKALLDAYYGGYFLPTLTDADRGALFGDLRVELQKDLANASSSEARKYVLGKVYGTCNKIADGANFHPGSRFNAILILSDLNETEMVAQGSTQVPPVPFNAVLVQLLKRYQTPDAPDVVKMGSLLGLRRHIELRTLKESPKPLDERQKSALANSFVPLLAMEVSPADRTPEGHDWMRRSAAELLGLLGQPGSDDGVSAALAKVIADEKGSLNLRAAAAAALGRIDLAKSKLDATSVTASYGKLAADCAKSEVDELKKFVNMGMSNEGPRGPMGYGPPNESNSRGEVEFADPLTIPVRRRFLARMQQVRGGLVGTSKKNPAGIAAHLPGAAEVMPPILKAIDGMIAVAKDPDTNVTTMGGSFFKDYKALAKQASRMAPPKRESTAKKAELPKTAATPTPDSSPRPAANIAPTRTP